jgi:pimeloyl-ACP methyl ester carboxylesterase
MPHVIHPQASSLARRRPARYASAIAVNPASGFGDPLENLAHKRPSTIAGAFFVPAMPCYGGRAREAFGPAGFQVSRFANPRTAATHNRLATVRGSSDNKLGALPMKRSHALNSSARAAAHKAMALAALRANSSLTTRLTRYNHHMAQARSLEQVGGAQ